MDDLISRRAAIEAFNDYEDTDGIKVKYVRQRIKDLPSPQPENITGGKEMSKEVVIGQEGLIIQQSSTVTLTLDEAEALEEYLWDSLIPYIKNDETDIDNLNWIRLICEVWKKCKDVIDRRKKNES